MQLKREKYQGFGKVCLFFLFFLIFFIIFFILFASSQHNKGQGNILGFCQVEKNQIRGLEWKTRPKWCHFGLFLFILFYFKRTNSKTTSFWLVLLKIKRVKTISFYLFIYFLNKDPKWRHFGIRNFFFFKGLVLPFANHRQRGRRRPKEEE